MFFKKTDSPSSSSHHLSIASPLGIKTTSPSPLCARMPTGLISRRSYVGHYSCSMFVCAVVLFCLVLRSLWFLWSFWTFFQNVTWTLEEEGMTQRSLLRPMFTDKSLHFDALWVSALASLHWIKTLLWWGWRATLIYGQRGVSESSLIPCQFSKLTIVLCLWGLRAHQPWFLTSFTVPDTHFFLW